MFKRDNLPTIRKTFGLTQTGLANLLGMTARAYQDIESGKSEFRPIHQLAIERALMMITNEPKQLAALPDGLQQDAQRLVDLASPRRT